MAETDLRTDLDLRTRGELQPPCDVTVGRGCVRCDKPATWHVRAQCPCGCSSPCAFSLMCDTHKTYLLNGGSWCCRRSGRSNRPVVEHLEALR